MDYDYLVEIASKTMSKTFIACLVNTLTVLSVNTTTTIVGNPESFLYNRLISEYHFSPAQIRSEVLVPIGQSRYKLDHVVNLKNGDLVLFETKKNISHISNGIMEQLKIQASIMNFKYVIISDGIVDKYFEVLKDKHGTILEQIYDISIDSFDGKHITKVSKTELRTSVDVKILLSSLFQLLSELSFDLPSTILLNQFLKIIMAKVYDELQQNEEPLFVVRKNEHPKIVKTLFENLIMRADSYAGYIFNENKIELRDDPLLQIISVLQRYSLIRSGITELGISFLLTNLADRRKIDFYSPDWLKNFIIELTNPGIGSNLLDPACGSGDMLFLARKRGSKVHGIERNSENLKIAKFNLFLSRINNHSLSANYNTLSLGRIDKSSESVKQSEKYDVIISSSPIIWGMNDKDSLYNDEQVVNNCWQLLKIDGIIVTLVSDGLLRNESKLKLRRMISKHFRILAVIGLPQNALLPVTGIKMSIIILKKVKLDESLTDYPVFFATANKVGNNATDETTSRDLLKIPKYYRRFLEGKPLESTDNLFIGKISEEYRFDVGFYENERSVNKIATETVSLSALVDIIPGLRYAHSNNGGEAYYYIRGQNISNLRVNIEKAETIRIKEAVNHKNKLVADDILLTKVGTVGNVGIFETDIDAHELNVVSSDNLVCLRVKDTRIVDPLYLLAFLSSDIGNAQIAQQTTGSAIESISIVALGKIRVPLFTLDIQKKIAKQTRNAFHLMNKIRLLQKDHNHIITKTSNEIRRLSFGQANL